MNEILCPELIANSLGSRARPLEDITYRSKSPEEQNRKIPTWEIFVKDLNMPGALRLEVIPDLQELDIHKTDSYGISTNLNLAPITGAGYHQSLVEFSNHHFAAKIHRNGHLTLVTQ